MSEAARTHHPSPPGTGLLPKRLSEAEIDDAPVLASLDDLVIEDLGDDEYRRFLDALGVA